MAVYVTSLLSNYYSDIICSSNYRHSGTLSMNNREEPMNTRIRSRRIELPRQALAHIERRLHFSLDRFALRISSVDVLIEDLNGPRGAADKSCRITIRLRPTGTVIARYVHPSLNTALAYAARCAEEAMARAVQRLRDRRLESRARPAQPPRNPALATEIQRLDFDRRIV
jgi:ribosome-associated translation inhibitor RaiA